MAGQGFSEPRISTHRLEDDRTLLGHRCPKPLTSSRPPCQPDYRVNTGGYIPSLRACLRTLAIAPASTPLDFLRRLALLFPAALDFFAFLAIAYLHGVPSLLLSDSPVAGELNWAFDHR